MHGVIKVYDEFAKNFLGKGKVDKNDKEKHFNEKGHFIYKSKLFNEKINKLKTDELNKEEFIANFYDESNKNEGATDTLRYQNNKRKKVFIHYFYDRMSFYLSDTDSNHYILDVVQGKTLNLTWNISGRKQLVVRIVSILLI